MSKKQYVVDPALFPELCTCGREHPPAGVMHYTGGDAYEILARDCAQAFATGSVLVLNDENTRLAAGEKVASLLASAGVKHGVLTLPGGVHADEARAQQVSQAAQEHDIVVAVGAGTINDLGKYASAGLERPYWCAPTAPSMNGFTSSIAAIKVAGVKRTLPAPPPRVIYADPEVICRAPAKLIQAGYCDILAKSVSDIDWQVDSLLFGGSYCALPTRLVARSESSYLHKPDEIGRGEPQAVMGLFEGLLVSGLAMTLAGSSAPASGGEHLVSHFLDMREPVTGREPELHGLQVALGIILSAACYQRLAALGPEAFQADPNQLFQAAAQETRTLWADNAAEVLERFELKRNLLARLPGLLSSQWSDVKKLCAQVEGPEHYLDLFRRTGLAMTLDSMRVERNEFLLAATLARTIRERITVLDLAAQGSVLKRAALETAEMLSRP